MRNFLVWLSMLVLFLLHSSLLYGLVVPGDCFVSRQLTRTCSAQSYLDTVRVSIFFCPRIIMTRKC